MRLFLGIEVPEDIKRHISQEITPLQTSSKGWENPHDYHLTLLFIGEMDESHLEDLQRRLKEVSFESFDLRTRSLNFFSRRVMYLGFHESLNLLNLRNKILTVFAEWAMKETKTFTPHLTIKRWQRYERAELDRRLAAIQMPEFQFPVLSVAIFKSEKDLHGRKYHVVFRSQAK